MRIENSICRVYSLRTESQVPAEVTGDITQSVNPCTRRQCEKSHEVSPFYRACVCNHDCNPCSESVGREK